jgi:hypothetical protein
MLKAIFFFFLFFSERLILVLISMFVLAAVGEKLTLKQQKAYKALIESECDTHGTFSKECKKAMDTPPRQLLQQHWAKDAFVLHPYLKDASILKTPSGNEDFDSPEAQSAFLGREGIVEKLNALGRKISENPSLQDFSCLGPCCLDPSSLKVKINSFTVKKLRQLAIRCQWKF